jgi:hypothetical protein
MTTYLVLHPSASTPCGRGWTDVPDDEMESLRIPAVLQARL